MVSRGPSHMTPCRYTLRCKYMLYCAMLWRLVPSEITESVGGPRSASVGTVSLGTGKLLPLNIIGLLSYVSRFDVIDALLDHVSNDESCPEHASLLPRCNRDLNICALRPHYRLRSLRLGFSNEMQLRCQIASTGPVRPANQSGVCNGHSDDVTQYGSQQALKLSRARPSEPGPVGLVHISNYKP